MLFLLGRSLGPIAYARRMWMTPVTRSFCLPACPPSFPVGPVMPPFSFHTSDVSSVRNVGALLHFFLFCGSGGVQGCGGSLDGCDRGRFVKQIDSLLRHERGKVRAGGKEERRVGDGETEMYVEPIPWSGTWRLSRPSEAREKGEKGMAYFLDWMGWVRFAMAADSRKAVFCSPFHNDIRLGCE
jgi:hypothetical protein